MMPFFFAWAVGEGIIVARWVKAGAPPTPGALLAPAGLFVGLAILAEAPSVRPVATAFAFAVDLAILLKVVGKAPAQVTGWPPALIDNPDVILPGAPTVTTGNTTTQSSGGAAAGSGSTLV